MAYQKLTVCNCKGTMTISGGSNLSGLVAHATPDRRLRRIGISNFSSKYFQPDIISSDPVLFFTGPDKQVVHCNTCQIPNVAFGAGSGAGVLVWF